MSSNGKEPIEIPTSEEEEEDQDDVYVVERILDAKQQRDGTFKYKIRWQGYESDEDTWEKEENVFDTAMLEEFWRSKGGRPAAMPKGIKRRRKGDMDAGATITTTAGRPIRSRSDDESDDDDEEIIASSRTATASKRNVNREYTEAEVQESFRASHCPPPGTWEKHMAEIETIEMQGNTLMAVVVWKNGERGKVHAKRLRDEVPMRLIDFYESHIRFKEALVSESEEES